MQNIATGNQISAYVERSVQCCYASHTDSKQFTSSKQLQVNNIPYSNITVLVNILLCAA